jgi:CSLREA domain-containing protein
VLSYKRWITLAIVCACVFVRVYWPTSSGTAAGTTYVVNSTADTTDGNCNAANCTLREAVLAANTNPGVDTINFNLAGTAPFTISLVGTTGSPPFFPNITDAVVIDGSSQPGFTSAPVVEIDGAGQEEHSCFVVQGGGTTIRSLAINACTLFGINLNGGGNTIAGNYIGLEPNGASHGVSASGINLGPSSANNMIGGLSSAARNVISGNLNAGIELDGFVGDPSGNQIIGNYVGVGADGSTALGNGRNGIWVRNSDLTGIVAGNSIGGVGAGEGNRIWNNSDTAAGITGDGINITAPSVSGISVRGNSIKNSEHLAIDLESGANNNIAPPVIFGPSPVLGSGCAGCQIDVYSTTSDGEGDVYHGSTTVGADGFWSFPNPGPVAGTTHFTATQTDGNGNTSEFSVPFNKNNPTPTPTRTSTSTPTRTPTSTPTRTATPTSTATTCPGPNTDATPLDNGPMVPGDDVTIVYSDLLLDACDPDDDNDGLSDGDEATGALCGGKGTNALILDSDGDHLADGWECAHGSDPTNATSRFMGTGNADADTDHVIDLWEQRGYNGSSTSTDTDADGCADLVELASVDDNLSVGDADRPAVARRALGIWGYDQAQDYVLDTDKNGTVGDSDRLFVARAVLLSDWLPKSCP